MMRIGIARDRGRLELKVSDGTQLIRQATRKVWRRKYIQRIFGCGRNKVNLKKWPTTVKPVYKSKELAPPASIASNPASVTIAIRPSEGWDGDKYESDLG